MHLSPFNNSESPPPSEQWRALNDEIILKVEKDMNGTLLQMKNIAGQGLAYNSKNF